MSILLFVSWMGQSCKKEDPSPPQIVLSNPFQGSQYQVPDSVFVSGSVSDANGLQSLQISLQNANQVPVGSAINIQVNGEKEKDFSGYLFLINPNLSAGSYFVKVTAVDNEGTKGVLYREIDVSDWPLVRKGFVYASIDGSNTAKSGYIDESGTSQSFQNRSTDVAALAINNREQHLILMGDLNGPTIAFDPNTNSPSNIYSVANLNTQTQAYFTSVYCYEDQTWLAYYDGWLRRLKPDGTVHSGYTLMNNHHAGEMLFSDGLLYVEMVNQGTDSDRMRMINTSSGVTYQDHTYNGDMVSILNKNSSSKYLIINKFGQAELYEYNLQSNVKTKIRNLGSGLAIDAVFVNANVVLVVQDDGVYEYDYSTSSYNLLNALNGVTRIVFDSTLNEYAIAQGSSLKIYEYPAGNMVASYSLSNDIVDLGIWYSR